MARSVRQQIRLERARQRLSLRELAAKTDLSVTTLAKLERGVTNPRLSTVVAVYEALGLDPAKAVEDEVS